MSKHNRYTYELLIQSENGEDAIPLDANSDTVAVNLAKQHLSNHPVKAGEKVFLAFQRVDDGQRAYLDRDGNASVTGQAWE